MCVLQVSHKLHFYFSLWQSLDRLGLPVGCDLWFLCTYSGHQFMDDYLDCTNWVIVVMTHIHDGQRQKCTSLFDYFESSV